MITKILIGIFIGVGLFMILADVFKIPYMRTSKAVNNLAKQQSEKTSSLIVRKSFAKTITLTLLLWNLIRVLLTEFRHLRLR